MKKQNKEVYDTKNITKVKKRVKNEGISVNVKIYEDRKVLNIKVN